MEGVAALLGSENGLRYGGVSQLQSHQSRYTVQLRPGLLGYPLSLTRLTEHDGVHIFFEACMSSSHKKVSIASKTPNRVPKLLVH